MRWVILFRGSQQFFILLFSQFSLTFVAFNYFSPEFKRKKVYTFSWLSEGFLTEKIFSNELFWTRTFFKKVKQFLLTTKCNMIKYDQIMNHCYRINELKRSVKNFPEFSLSAFIFQEIPLGFPVFPDFFYFPDFSLIFKVSTECCETPCILMELTINLKTSRLPWIELMHITKR